MLTMYGIPFGADRATFESFEQRVEDRALRRHLADYDRDDVDEQLPADVATFLEQRWGGDAA